MRVPIGPGKIGCVVGEFGDREKGVQCHGVEHQT